MCNAASNDESAGQNWICLLAGAALLVGGIVILTRMESLKDRSQDPLADAQRMLSRAKEKVTEIEAGLRAARETLAA